MTVWCYVDSAKRKSRRLARLFASGCAGRIAQNAKTLFPGEAFFYGITPRQRVLWTQAQGTRTTYYYGDNGYAPGPAKADGQPTEIFRITRNARQVTEIGRGDADRRDRYMPPIRPWHRNGRDILVCLQSAYHFDLHGGGLTRDRWLSETMASLRQYTDRPIIVRDKPLRKPGEMPFEVALALAWAVVTFDSRVAVEALLAGVPAFVTAKCAASPMAGRDLSRIEDPPRPDGRAEWAAWLAANQWTAAEIGDGTAWRDLNEA